MGKHISSYECHITTTVADAGKAEEIAKELGWKTSEIKRDPLLGDGSHFYLTAHHISYDPMYKKMRATAEVLKAAGCTVLREKIEGIIFDTKTRNYGGDEHKHIDEYAVADFAKLMDRKMLERRAQGKGGWQDPSLCQLRPDLLGRLISHARMMEGVELGNGRAPVVAGVLVDIANYAMLAHYRIMNGVANTKPVTFCKKCEEPDYACSCVPSYKERT